MNNNIFVYFDNRVIGFVHSVAEDSKGNYKLFRTKPEWHDILCFLNGKEDRLLYVNDHPEMHFRHFLTFFVPVEAAGGLVINGLGEWLFIFRNGRWDLPKGLVEETENSAQAAIREVQEECGITDIKILHSLQQTYHVYPGKTSDWMLKKTQWYLMQTPNDSALCPQTEEGIEKVEWRNPNSIDDILENTYGNIRDLLNPCKEQGFC